MKNEIVMWVSKFCGFISYYWYDIDTAKQNDIIHDLEVDKFINK